MDSHQPKDRVFQCRACAAVLPTHEASQVCPSCKVHNIFADHQKVAPPTVTRIKTRRGKIKTIVGPDLRCKGHAACGGECVLEAQPRGAKPHVHVCEGDSVGHAGVPVPGTCRGVTKPSEEHAVG